MKRKWCDSGLEMDMMCLTSTGVVSWSLLMLPLFLTLQYLVPVPGIIDIDSIVSIVPN